MEKSRGLGLTVRSEAQGIKELTYAERFATKLANALRAKRRVTGAVNLQKWSLSFDKLLARISEGEIEEVLDWYIANIDSIDSKVMSAKSFALLFLWLKREKENSLACDHISAEAKTITDRLLKNLVWFGGSHVQLGPAVQKSLDAYTAFRKAVFATIERLQKKVLQSSLESRERNNVRRLLGFAKFLKDNQLASPNHFIEQWWVRVNASVQNWQGWSGDLRAFVFSVDSKRLEQQGRDWANAYCNEWQRWDMLLKEIK